MPAKDSGGAPTPAPSEKVTEITVLDKSNFKEVQAVSTTSVTEKEFEDFIESSEFLGENSLFVRYGTLLDENASFDTESTEASEDIAEQFDTPPKINSSSALDFDLGFVRNLLAMANENLSQEQYIEFINSLPNQIRALFFYNLRFVKNLQNFKVGDLIKNLNTQAIINVNYFKLVRVEIHDGYETTLDGQIMINKPTFRLLKKQDLDSLTKTTMCRLVRYYENNLKIKRDLLSFPIEEQIFFINPANPTPLRPLIDRTAELRSIAGRHFLSGEFDLVASTSNIITQTTRDVTQLTVPNENLTVPNENLTVPNENLGSPTEFLGATTANRGVETGSPRSINTAPSPSPSIAATTTGGSTGGGSTGGTGGGY